jgi:acyl-CoA thioesterase-1
LVFIARAFVAILLLGAATGVAAAGSRVLVFGDSLSAAYGIAQSRGWVALLGERLKRERPDYSLVNASISGETSAGGRARIDRVLEQHKPSVVILELGSNDGLRGLPVAQMRQNLEAIAAAARKAGARVVLVGMRMPPNYGPDYTRAFDASFADVARRQGAALVPFLFEGFAENEAMFQPDRLHPTEAAQPVMLENVWKVLRPLLR